MIEAGEGLTDGQDIDCSRLGIETKKYQRVVHRMLVRYHGSRLPTSDVIEKLSSAQTKPSCTQCESNASLLLENGIMKEPMALLSSESKSVNDISWCIVRPLKYLEVMRSSHFKIDIWKNWNPDEIINDDVIRTLKSSNCENSKWIPTDDIVRISREVVDKLPFNELELVLLGEQSMEIENSDSKNDCIEQIRLSKHGRSSKNNQQWREWVRQQKMHRQKRRKERRNHFKKAQKQDFVGEEQSKTQLQPPDIQKLFIQLLQHLTGQNTSKPPAADSLNFEKIVEQLQPSESMDINEIQFHIIIRPYDGKDKNESPPSNNGNTQPLLSDGDIDTKLRIFVNSRDKNCENEFQLSNYYEIVWQPYNYDDTFYEANQTDDGMDPDYNIERNHLRIRVNKLVDEFWQMPKALRIYHRKQFWQQERRNRLQRRQQLRQRIRDSKLQPSNEESDELIKERMTSLDNECGTSQSNNDGGNSDHFDQNTCGKVPNLTVAMNVDDIAEESNNTESMIANTSAIIAPTTTFSGGVSMNGSIPSIEIMASEFMNETISHIVKTISKDTERCGSPVAVVEPLRPFGDVVGSTENNSNRSREDYGQAVVSRSVTTMVKALSLVHIELFNGVKRMLSAVRKTMHPPGHIPAPVDQVTATGSSNASNSDAPASDVSISDVPISVPSASVDPDIIEKQKEMLRELQRLLDSIWSMMLNSNTNDAKLTATSMSDYIEETANRTEETANNINEADDPPVVVPPITITTMMKAYLEMVQTLERISNNVQDVTRMLSEETNWLVDAYKWAGEVAKMGDRVLELLEDVQANKEVRNNEELPTQPSPSLSRRQQEQQERYQMHQFRLHQHREQERVLASQQYREQERILTSQQLPPPKIVHITISNTAFQENEGSQRISRRRRLNMLANGRRGNVSTHSFNKTDRAGFTDLPDGCMFSCTPMDDLIDWQPPPTVPISSRRPTQRSIARSTSTTGSTTARPSTASTSTEIAFTAGPSTKETSIDRPLEEISTEIVSTARPSTEEIFTDRPSEETSTKTTSTETLVKMIHSNTSSGNVSNPTTSTPSTVHTSPVPISSEAISIVESSLITNSTISTTAVQNSIAPISITLETSTASFVEVKDSSEIPPSIESTISVLTSNSPTLTSPLLISETLAFVTKTSTSQTSAINGSKEQKLLNHAVIPNSIDMQLFNGLQAIGVLISNLFLSQQPSLQFVETLIQNSITRMAVIVTALTDQSICRKQVSSDRRLLRRGLNGPLRQHLFDNDDDGDENTAYCEENTFPMETETPTIIDTPASNDDLTCKQLPLSPETGTGITLHMTTNELE
jgi:hypothetical protein